MLKYFSMLSAKLCIGHFQMLVLTGFLRHICVRTKGQVKLLTLIGKKKRESKY